MVGVATRTRKKPAATITLDDLLSLDLGCGQNKVEGFHGVDNAPDSAADTMFDLFAGDRWPFEDSSVGRVVANHLVEHIPHYHPGYHGRDGWFVFFDELYRVCADGAECRFVHPYAQNERAFWDPTHTRYIHEMTWYYTNKAWREAQRLDHYPVAANFDVANITSGVHPEFEHRADEVQRFAKSFYWNAIGDLSVVLVARKPA